MHFRTLEKGAGKTGPTFEPGFMEKIVQKHIYARSSLRMLLPESPRVETVSYLCESSLAFYACLVFCASFRLPNPWLRVSV
jgi:hypothetical protein